MTVWTKKVETFQVPSGPDAPSWQLLDLYRFKSNLDLDMLKYPTEAHIYEPENGPQAIKKMMTTTSDSKSVPEKSFQKDIRKYNNIYCLEKDFSILPKYGYRAIVASDDLSIINYFEDVNGNVYIPISILQLDFGLRFPLHPFLEDILRKFNVCLYRLFLNLFGVLLDLSGFVNGCISPTPSISLRLPLS